MIDVRVNGETFNLFKQVDLYGSMDEVLQESRIIVTEQANNSSFISEGDLIEIWLDGVKKFTGYIDNIDESENNEAHDILYSARSKPQDIIDSSVPDNVKYLKGTQKYSDLWNLCITGLGLTGISVTDSVGGSFNADDKAANVGETCGDFLQKYARKVQAFPVATGDGNIEIRQPQGKLKTLLLNIKNGRNNNIIDSTYSNDISQRFNKYIVRSNGNIKSNISTGQTGKKVMNVKGEFIDSEIRSGRVFEKVAESPMSEAECIKAAKEEANIRKIRGFNYICEVSGFSANGELWEEGVFVSIKDLIKGVQGDFLIKDVKYLHSNQGEKTIMTITYPDAYTGKSIYKSYKVNRGDTLSDIANENNVLLGDIIQANPQIINPNLIETGQTINIPTRSIKS